MTSNKTEKNIIKLCDHLEKQIDEAVNPKKSLMASFAKITLNSALFNNRSPKLLQICLDLNVKYPGSISETRLTLAKIITSIEENSPTAERLSSIITKLEEIEPELLENIGHPIRTLKALKGPKK